MVSRNCRIVMLQMLIDQMLNLITWHFPFAARCFADLCCYDVVLLGGGEKELDCCTLLQRFEKGENAVKTWNLSENLFRAPMRKLFNGLLTFTALSAVPGCLEFIIFSFCLKTLICDTLFLISKYFFKTQSWLSSYLILSQTDLKKYEYFIHN